MSNDSFEPPWSGMSLIQENNMFESPATISEIICRLENLLHLRKKLSCPNDDVDNRILSVTRRAVEGIKLLLEQQGLTTDDQNQSSIENNRFLIREAISVFEKTLKILKLNYIN